MKSPRWARALLMFLAPRHREDDVVGDLEESHRQRSEERGPLLAMILSTFETIDLAYTILRDRVRKNGPTPRQPTDVSDEDVLTGIGFSWLDFKLGFRMLVKFPGLTVVAGVAIAFAIALGTGTFEFTRDFFFPTMPFEDGDRIVEIWSRDIEEGGPDPRILHDFEVWQEELATVEAIGALQTFQRNLSTDRISPVPLMGAAITAEAFGIPRTPPMLGRPVAPADALPGAEPIVVISYDVWQRHFGGDPDVVGQTVRLASEHRTVVGVMPEGFGWPRNYDVWTGLQMNPVDYLWGESPGIQVVARRAPGASLGDVRNEVTSVAQRIASAYPAARGQHQAEVHRWGGIEVDMSGLMLATFFSLNMLAFVALLVLVAGNVALLLFARTAARHQEIVVRSALGASRGRIVSQLFAEALVLGTVACGLGLVGAQLGLDWSLDLLSRVAQGAMGTWFFDPMSKSTIAYALIFTVVAAVISGILPAVKITGKDVQKELQRAGGNGSGREFGRLWSGIIITQIGVTVAFVPIIIVVGTMALMVQKTPYGFAANEYLMAEVRHGQTVQNIEEMTRVIGGDGHTEEYAETYWELKRRLELEPAVAGVTVAEQVPGAPQNGTYVEVDGPHAVPRWGPFHWVSKASVDEDFFDALNAPMVSGRDFGVSDAEGTEHAVVVDEDFVRSVLEDRNPLGRRIRIIPWGLKPEEENPNPWLEIVGVVGGIAQAIDPESLREPAIYTPLRADEVYPVRFAIHVGADPATFSGRLREVAVEVDPSAIITNVRPLEQSAWVVHETFSAWFKVLVAMGTMGILLATAGIYSIMSFTVSRRTREIGVRVALGADKGRIVWAILKRTFRQITFGVTLGAVLIGLFLLNPEIGYRPQWWHFGVLGGYLLIMTMVCGLACIVPAGRALAIEPTEALRAEG